MSFNATNEHLSSVLSTYAGRDKALRSMAFYLQHRSTSSPTHSKELLALAKQLSAARLVMRQFNHPSMLKACQQVINTIRSDRVGTSIDPIEFGAGAAVTGIYSIYGFVELFAWLSDAKILAFDSARLYRYCLYLWLVALVSGIIRQLRIISRKSIDKAKDDIITLIGLSADFISGVNSLPHKVLWAGKLSLKQSASFSLLASIIGFYKLWYQLLSINLSFFCSGFAVTGAAGFIGSHTVLELVDAGHTVLCIDNFANAIPDENGNAVSLRRVSEIVGKPIPFENVDVCDEEALENVFATNKFDGVIHLAALKAVGESVAEPLKYYQNNLVASLNLCKMCLKYNVNNFVFSSSATVYGSPKELPITESSPTGQGITNPYGQTKYMMEQILIDVAKANTNWNVIILRYFNPVGAHKSGMIGEDPKGVPNNLMPYVSQVAIGKLKVLTIYGDKFDTIDGTGVRDYIHVVDLAKGHVKALDRVRNIGIEIYNLGTGVGYSVRQMVEAMKKASGREIPTQIGVPRPGDVASVYCDPSLAAEKLGWKAEFGLDEMCADLWNWQSKNPKGFAA
ncbi:unnamed protein product [Caenorhabditis bovis]|uniref:UDP-N-acetylglucosamine 4-epimerase n=1 Tax=Caenorhabditis bovis TaxID=2654633 RepID=A0A8S1F1Z1_9PELO|nr:unnamed protein product [Caenorhabditis bovis]